MMEEEERNKFHGGTTEEGSEGGEEGQIKGEREGKRKYSGGPCGRHDKWI